MSIHEIDLDLVFCVKQILRKTKKNHPARNRLEKTLKEYEDACLLAKGKDINRSIYWSNKAVRAMRRLQSLELDMVDIQV